MEILKTLKDSDFGFDEKPGELKLREAARSVVVNDFNELAILYVSTKNFYKIPGGGVEAGENYLSALKREVREEAGCEIEVTRELGAIIEYRTHFKVLQKSYCYLAKVVGKVGAPQFDPGELADGFEVKWMSLAEAEKRIKTVKTDDYLGQFVTDRELTILKEAKKYL